MCFFKQLQSIQQQETVIDSPHKSHSDDTSAEILTQNEFSSFPDNRPCHRNSPNFNMLLLNCFGMMNLNSQMMFALDQKLNKAQDVLSSGSDILSEPASPLSPALKRSSSMTQNSLEKDETNLVQTADPLTKQLFGNCGYKYKLVVDGEFPSTLYKERNFGFSVKLVDIQTGKDLNNGNIVNICFGVCDDNGEWIHQTKEGQAFVKGKIQTELYHGSAGFARMAARDVSRIYPNRMVNVVVYPKPSVLKYSGESSIEEHVDFSLIEPLVVHGVCIKAKKRE